MAEEQSPISYESTPRDDRPRCLPIFPDGWRAFDSRRAKLQFAVLLLPALVSCTLFGLQGGDAIAGAVVLAILLTFVATSAFVALRSGMSSSSGGTFYRAVDGWRYWRDIVVLLGVYALFCFVPLINGMLNQSKKAANRPAIRSTPAVERAGEFDKHGLKAGPGPAIGARK